MSRRLQLLCALTSVPLLSAAMLTTAASANAAAAVTRAVTKPVTKPVTRPIITPAQAAAVVKAYTKTINKADLTYNIALQDTVETGAARVNDDADFRLSKIVGYAPYRPFSYVGTRIFMPRQTHYPLLFVALTHGKSTGQPAAKDTTGLVFQKGSASAKWKLSSWLSFAATAVPTFTVDKDGYLPTLVTSTLSVTPTAMYPALVKAQGLAAHGKKPSAAWAYNSIWKNNLSLSAADAADTHETFSSSHLAPVCVASKTGALCFTSTAEVRLQTTSAGEQAGGIFWRISTADDRYNAGGVAVGSYTTLRTVAQREIAVVIPRKKAKAKLMVSAEYWGPVSGTGTPVPSA